MDYLYRKYQNIQIWMENYRKWEITSAILNKEDFLTEMQTKQFVRIGGKENATIINVFLFTRDSQHLADTKLFKQLLDKLKPSAVYLVSKEDLPNKLQRAIDKYGNLKIIPLYHRHFTIEIPKGPSAKHEIMTPEEVKNIIEHHLGTVPINLPAISVYDPQCIWIGAKVRDVVRIISYSDIGGKCETYKIVTPKTGRTLHHSKIISTEITEEKTEEKTEIEEEYEEEDWVTEQEDEDEEGE